MQRCGVYSVVRGIVDRDAFRMTRALLFKGGWRSSSLAKEKFRARMTPSCA